MKKLVLFLAAFVATAVLGSAIASAEEKEKVVTASISTSSVSVKLLDEYISSQLYTGSGVFNRLNVRFSALYRKHDNLSWDAYFVRCHRLKKVEEMYGLPQLQDPANSQKLKYSAWSCGYGTYYHWKFGEKLMVKTGGLCDLYASYKESTPDGVNNNVNIELQVMLKAHAAIKYGWDFKKWGLDLRANMSLPVIGLITADHPSEPAMSIFGTDDHSVMRPAVRHIFLGSYHNYMSLDYELGVDFVFKPLTLQLAHGSTSKWWNVYDIQNIRKINYWSLGVAFDIVSRNRFKSSNNNF